MVGGVTALQRDQLRPRENRVIFVEEQEDQVTFTPA